MNVVYVVMLFLDESLSNEPGKHFLDTSMEVDNQILQQVKYNELQENVISNSYVSSIFYSVGLNIVDKISHQQ